ncbi:OmpA family protein [Mesorhizobium sp. BAC0120]|uniref:OmpA family protein n=1 Tax=Mesorhizobium sp. BAC0120 TaxID=3090670 RepID=UPI00298C0BED|nr:OmpA family protein [Mesorhizobium sp. BAC0120]MDW6021080.1 OmpA family protein [Mesorhizobium sp. BAC0120]
MISASGIRNALALAALLVTGSALSEPLTNQQLIQSLGQVTEAAPAVDPAVLMEEITANVGKGVAALPNFAQLAAMPQLTVEINFEYGSVAIVPESYRTVGVIADALHYPTLLGRKFLIVGHTDSTGDANSNLTLSLRRAEAIRDALSTTFAVPPDRLFAIGVGEEMPLDAAHPTAAANRRVQLINIGWAQ